MTYGLNSPLYAFKVAGQPLNGIWSLAGVPATVVVPGGGLDAAAFGLADLQSPSELMIDPPIFTDVHPTGRIYPMLQEALRQADESGGSEILRRLLIRSEFLWQRQQQKIWRITLLNDPRHTPDSLLTHLRAIVGFGQGSGRPDDIARSLGPADLRKLVKVAVPYWKRRGLRRGLQAAIRTFTGADPTIDDFFYVRWIVGEVLIGIAGGPGSDPWGVYASAFDVGSSGGDTRVEIRVAVQDAVLQNTVLELAALARPAGEHYGVAFVDWIDPLQSGRLPWWKTQIGAGGTYVAPNAAANPPALGALSLPMGTVEKIAPGGEAAWTAYVWQGVASYSAIAARPQWRFYATSTDYYAITITPSASIVLSKVVGGAPAVLATDVTTPTAPAGARGFRIEIERNAAGTSNTIRFYLDGQLCFGGPVADNAHTAGSAMIANVAAAPSSVLIHRSEIFQQPLRYVEVGPNY